MWQMIFLAALLAMGSLDCAAGNYKNVKFGPYSDSPQEDLAIGNLAPPVENFRGSKAPQVFLTGRRRGFSFSEGMAGVSTASITGPYGVVYSKQFSPPIKSTGVAIYDLPAGAYYVRSYNAVGALTENRIVIAELEPELDLNGSYLSAGKMPGRVNIHLAAKGRASEGLRSIELIQNGKLAGVVHGKGGKIAASFDTSAQGSAAQTQFILQVSDNEGNYRQLRFALDGNKIPRQLKAGETIPLADKISFAGASRPWRTVPEASDYTLLLGNGLKMKFKNVKKTGEISNTWTTARPPNGYLDAIGAAFILRGWNGLQFESARVFIEYGVLGLSPGQISSLKVVRVDDPRDGKYTELQQQTSAGRREVSAELKGLGKYMLAAAQYGSVNVADSQRGKKGADTEIEFLSGVNAQLSVFDMKSGAGASLINELKGMNLLPVSNVYRIWPENKEFEPSGALKMRYLDKTVSALGVDEKSLALYTLSLNGDVYKLPYLTQDREGNLLTAMVPRTHQLFAVLGSSTQAENVPPLFYPDGIPPSSKIAFSGPREGEYISTMTFIVLTAEDAKVPSVLTSGVAGIFYFMQSEGVPQVDMQLSTYTQPFTLKEGLHTISYLAQDKAGNYEFPVSLKLSVDGTPPATTAAINGGKLVLTAIDPVSNGVSSKVQSIFYALDAIPAGSRAAGRYSGPVALPAGKHTVYYFSMDNVGNMETVNSLVVDVPPRAAKRKGHI